MTFQFEDSDVTVTPEPSGSSGLPTTSGSSGSSSCNGSSNDGNYKNGAAAVATAGDQIEALAILPAVEPERSNTGEVNVNVNGAADMLPPPPPKSKVRAKVPLEKGYSQMVWLRLLQTEPDLAGLKGASPKRLITMEEVKQHKTDEDAWTVLRGRVYNISPYIRFHPGGRDMLMKGAGRDCTSLFNKYHAWVNAEFLLEKCIVGVLDIPQ